MATSFAWGRWAPWNLWATSTPQDFARWVTRCGTRTIIESLIARRYRSMPTTGSKRPESKPLLHPPMRLAWGRSQVYRSIMFYLQGCHSAPMARRDSRTSGLRRSNMDESRGGSFPKSLLHQNDWEHYV